VEIKIFWQPDCPACPPAKELGKALEAEGNVVKYFNVKEPDGLAEAVLHSLMSTPSIVIVKNGKEIKTWKGQVPTLNTLKSVVNG
jgi:thiol-disulfide isomerase/thioredoxin